MPQLRPGWQLSITTAAILVLIAVLCAPARRRRWAAVIGGFAREFALVMALLGLWQWVGGYVHTRVAGALERGVQIYHWQQWLHLPSEVWLQKLILPFPWLVRAADTFYGYAHLNAMGLLLVWLWVRHRDVYRDARGTVVLSTLICLLVQIVPVAPPRLFPRLGFVDTALLYNESVYGAFGSGMANQLSAMPSVHVAWAVIVGWYVWRASPSRWRFVGALHAVITVLVVVVTANHWWLDGIVAAVIVIGSGLVSLAARRAGSALLVRLQATRLTRQATSVPAQASTSQERGPSGAVPPAGTPTGRDAQRVDGGEIVLDGEFDPGAGAGASGLGSGSASGRAGS